MIVSHGAAGWARSSRGGGFRDGIGRRGSLGRVRHRRVADPRSRAMRVLAGGQALPIERSVTVHDARELVPVDRSKMPVPGLRVMA